MKYPKTWEGNARSCFVASSTSDPDPQRISLYVYVDRPGTSDHGRSIHTRLSTAEARRVRDELTHHIELLEQRKEPTS